MGVIYVKHVTISTYFYCTQIQDYIYRRLQALTPKECMPVCKVFKKDTFTSVAYYFPSQVSLEDQALYFRDYIVTPIAKAITDVIQYVFAVEYATAIINENNELSCKEKIKIIQLFNEAWQISFLYKKHTKVNELVDPILQELLNEQTITIEGWIQFRLSSYKKYIKDTVNQIIFEYMAYIEYKEFLALLRQFIEGQKSMIDIIQIMPGSNGEIHLYDQNNNEVTKRCIEQYGEIIDGSERNIEDEILNVLITIAPLRIILHKKENCRNKQLITTIQKVYQDKVQICQNCEYCNNVNDMS